MAKPKRICSIDGCDKFVKGHGLCNRHYLRVKRGGDASVDGRTGKRINFTCSVDGCSKKARYKTLCEAHHERWKRHGNPLLGRTPQGRLMEFIHDVVLKHDSDDCLLWPFGRDKFGYGVFWREGKKERVHRYVCEAAHGQCPSSEYEGAHTCGGGDAGCVAPLHLGWKTHTDNMADATLHGTTTQGEMSFNAVLTEADVKLIRQNRHQETARMAVQKFGVHPKTIYRVRQRLSWKHVD
ncbi:hypothetical protein N5C81_29075 [Rhizobium pusense]|uniref:hypothetical protein n=1 Tax=Agrobacterium pusense TaxID=648995 RepID=UPI0024487754|nr:hypothetical protein [Agrobacterium pusense]MDH1271644.1 hypothetical protein [Agrobacterium pusense]